MQPTATDDPVVWSVSLSLVLWKWIKVPFGLETLGDIVLDGGPDPPMARGKDQSMGKSFAHCKV